MKQQINCHGTFNNVAEGDGSAPAKSAAAGTVAIQNIVRHAVAGSATFTTSAARMPMQMRSWFTEPRKPRIRVGATSLMYSGTSAEAKPMPRPTSARPVSKALGVS